MPSTGSNGGQPPLLSLEGVHVAFGATGALADETLRLWPGEIVGLLGHNGAGKSTLVNVATGALRPKRGTMTLNGQEVPLRGDPRYVEHLGIKVIHQEPALASNLSICDNITLGHSNEHAPRKQAAALRSIGLARIGACSDSRSPLLSR